MKKGTAGLFLVLAFILVLGIGPAWALECPTLYAECQELLKTIENEEAARMCEEGIRLHKAGDHDASVDILEAALEMLQEEKQY